MGRSSRLKVVTEPWDSRIANCADVGVCGRALKLASVGEGFAMKESMITGCQPDSGKPTVRDDRGACGNVGYGQG